MPPEGVPPRRHDEILSYEELRPSPRAAVAAGISKVRVTGGEPLVRKGCADFVAQLAAHPRHRRHLAHHQRPAAAALRRRSARRRPAARQHQHRQSRRRALRGASRAAAARRCAGRSRRGLRGRLRAGQGQRSCCSPASRTSSTTSSPSRARRDVHVRFIEYMPLDRRVAAADRAQLVPAGDWCSSGCAPITTLRASRRPLRPRPGAYWRVPGARGTIGFIAGVSDHFCDTCNRLRLTADGRLSTCLFSRPSEVDVRPLIERPAELRAAIAAAVAGKSYDRMRRGARPTTRHVADRRLTAGSHAGERTDLSHLDERGRARMVDVGGKDETARAARAEARVVMAPATLAPIRDGARAQGRRPGHRAPGRHHGGQAHARAHPALPPARADVRRRRDRARRRRCPVCASTSEARLSGRTGVEMEALVAASVAALTIYDMCKAIDRGMEIAGVRLLEKGGGASGHWRREGRATPLTPRARARAIRPPGTVVSVNVAATRACASSRGRDRRWSSSTASPATPTPAPGTARSACSPSRASRRCAPGARRGSRRLRRERHHRGPRRRTSCRSARGCGWADAGRGHPDRQGLPRPLRHLPRRRATASCRARASSCACCEGGRAGRRPDRPWCPRAPTCRRRRERGHHPRRRDHAVRLGLRRPARRRERRRARGAAAASSGAESSSACCCPTRSTRSTAEAACTGPTRRRST